MTTEESTPATAEPAVPVDDDTGDVATTAAPGNPPPSWMSSRRGFWTGAGALAVVLVALLPVIDNGYIAVPDEGVYSAQAANLAEGSWWSERPWPDLDPDAEHIPLLDSVVDGDRLVPYSRHPLYPLVLVPGFLLAEQGGMLLISVFGTWAAAVAAGLIGRRLDPSIGLWTLLVTGVGSPLLFDAYTVIAHSLAAACAGFAFLGLERYLADRSWPSLTWALPAVVAMVLLRSEGTVVALALGAAVTLIGFATSRRANIHWDQIALGAATAALALITYVLDTRWAASISGVAGYGTDTSELILADRTGPLDAAWNSLVSPIYVTWINSSAARVLVPVCVILGAAALAVMPKRSLLSISLLTLAAAGGVLQLMDDPNYVTGLFAAFPLLPAGFLLLRRRQWSRPAVQRGTLTVAFACLLLLLTIHGGSGTSEWGGRFFHVLLPLAVPVSVLGWSSGLERIPGAPRRAAVVALAVATLTMSFTSVRTNDFGREHHADIVSGSTAALQELRSTTTPDVVLVNLEGRGSGGTRAFWRDSDATGVLDAGGFQGFFDLLDRTEPDGSTEFLIVSNVNPDLFGMYLVDGIEERGWTPDELERSAPTRRSLVWVRATE